MGKIFYLMGKSSSGKDTIYKKIIERNQALQTVVLYTTRPARAGERDGETYHFCNEADLARIQSEGRLIEVRAYDTMHGIWKYFTADDGQFDLSNYDYLMIGTLQSYEKMRAYFGETVVYPIYIETEDGVRLQRALEREQQQEQPKYAEMCRRFLADEEDFSEAKLREAGIVKRFQNKELDACVMEIENTISFEKDML